MTDPQRFLLQPAKVEPVNSPLNRPNTPQSIRLFRVRLNSEGIDGSGCKWEDYFRMQHVHGLDLYCATDQKHYQEFVWADSRFRAAAELLLPYETIKVKVTLPKHWRIERWNHKRPTEHYRVLFRKQPMSEEFPTYGQAFHRVQQLYLGIRAGDKSARAGLEHRIPF